MNLPLPVSAYLRELTDRLRDGLGTDLLGAYAAGSIALDAFDPGRSDIDIAVVCDDGVDHARRSALVDALRSRNLRCPARGLELVAYPRSFAASGAAGAGYVLELNDGPDMPFRAHLTPAEREGDDDFWYVIDRSIVRACGVPLAGPSADELFGSPPDALILDALRVSVGWHRRGTPDRNAVLNTCRALRWAAERTWSSKDDSGRWLLARGVDSPGAIATANAVTAALADAQIPAEDADRFLDAALEELATAT